MATSYAERRSQIHTYCCPGRRIHLEILLDLKAFNIPDAHLNLSLKPRSRLSSCCNSCPSFGVPWWPSRLRVWHRHCCSLGCCCGVGLIPDPGTFMCYGHSQKNKNRHSHCGSVVTNPTGNHEDLGSIPGLTKWVKDLGIAVSCGVGRRCSWDPVWLWPGSISGLGTSTCHRHSPPQKKWRGPQFSFSSPSQQSLWPLCYVSNQEAICL